MSDGEFPFQNFTVRAEGYDRGEVDAAIGRLQAEITEQRRALEAATPASTVDARLHDPEGAVTRTLAIAQETADRVLHDAQVEADRRRSEADEQAAGTIADADARAAKMMADIETQTAEVRAQGIAAARSAIQVERDKAVAELGQIRRVRDDIRAEAVELRSVLERYARQANEASEILGAAAAGPLLASQLPDYVADDVALAGVLGDDEVEDPVRAEEVLDSTDAASWTSEDPAEVAVASTVVSEASFDDDIASADAGGDLVWGDDDVDVADDAYAVAEVDEPAVVEAAADADDDDWFGSDEDDAPLADVISIDGDSDGEAAELPSDLDDTSSASSGAFLAEVRAAADDDTVMLPPESEGADDSDRFLSELRGVTDPVNLDDAELDSDVADRFFDSED
jgi:F0F1-type ATP synthase membrane subunit b/b'